MSSPHDGDGVTNFTVSADADADADAGGGADGSVDADGGTVGVGAWPGGPQAWPDDPRLDPQLLTEGDRRNVADHYRYWTVEAIVADLDTRRHPLHVAIENLGHDFNIGSVVRTANAFSVAGVHVVGRRRWNRRGAMVTDRYLHLHHHDDAAALAAWAQQRDLPLLGVDNVPGSVPIEHRPLPTAAVLLFGQESGGLSPEARRACREILHITQYGSTRSMNVGAAAAIAMYSWMLQHAGGPPGEAGRPIRPATGRDTIGT